MRKKGISLIVLIITIIVVIILAAVVILTLSKNNPIESAKEARFKEDVRTFQDELALTVSKQYTTAGGHRDEKITTSDFDEIKEYIPSFSEKYRDKFIIQDDELVYTKQLDEKEKEYAQSLNVKEKQKLLPAEYQQVEYIEGRGTQYINTKIPISKISSLKTNFNLKFAVTNIRGTYILGGANDSFKQIVFIHNKIRQDWKKCTDTSFFNTEIEQNKVYNFIQEDGKCKFETESITLLSSSNSNLEFGLFARIDDAQGHVEIPTISKMRLYEFNVSDLNNPTHMFIPCYANTTVTNVDGEICEKGTAGLYDLVERNFYTNKGDKTKGDFVCGPEV